MRKLLLLCIRPGLLLALICLLFSCQPNGKAGSWHFQVQFDDETKHGTLHLESGLFSPTVRLHSFEWGEHELQSLHLSEEKLSGEFELWGRTRSLSGLFEGDQFTGIFIWNNDSLTIQANRLPVESFSIDRSGISYLMSEDMLEETEQNLDHAGLIHSWDYESLKRGERTYNAICVNCHGTPESEGSIPDAQKFWEETFKAGHDPFSLYQTLTRGTGIMPPQPNLSPREKYDVIQFVRERFMGKYNPETYFPVSEGYLAGLPKGTSLGPDVKPYHPWSDMDYGNFFINTYELVDEETGPPRYHSPGPSPFPDEDYSTNNFAYKGIAIRLDEGEGGISKGKAWMIFDHDVMRVAGGWTGEGFIDWDGILLNDVHETYPRTIGKLHFETPVGPGWANPETGSFEDIRWRARDGRPFGPLPKSWANYKGLYHHGDHIVLSYSVGDADILEELGQEEAEGQTIFTRTLNIAASSTELKMRIAPLDSRVRLIGTGGNLIEEEGFYVLSISANSPANVKIFIADAEVDNLDAIVQEADAPEDLTAYTNGGPAHYPETVNSLITAGNESRSFAIDILTPPFDNPWKARMKLSGIDFLSDPNQAVACATDGDVWLISGLTDGSTTLTWRRIAAGMFQPLGIKVLEDKIYVICRDQLVLLRDLNGDGETDFYESFNHDHQVTDHFHEFAMGLQADKTGNLYYAKSGRHAREALIPQHGTLIKVSADGSESEIIATGFRAANGVCINPDGSFLVTDQQGYWNPMNRINWVEVDGEAKFYGNMWGYNPPKDSSRNGMEPPMLWVDMEFDRSPSELLWVDSEAWGPLNGALLSFSYGFGKIQLVYPERVNGQVQGALIDLPDIRFLTGVMRGRFNPEDGHLYACGMSAWGTNQMMRGGGLYRIRYLDKPLSVPIELNTFSQGIEMRFDRHLDAATAEAVESYEVESWTLIRSKKYGSDRHNRKFLEVSGAELTQDQKGIRLYLPEIQAVDVMTIQYKLTDKAGNPVEGKLQQTIHHLPTTL